VRTIDVFARLDQQAKLFLIDATDRVQVARGDRQCGDGRYTVGA
jgi:hypothetical protein